MHHGIEKESLISEYHEPYLKPVYYSAEQTKILFSIFTKRECLFFKNNNCKHFKDLL